MLFGYPLQVCGYLSSKSWDTRIAAGHAVAAIAQNVKKWQPASGTARVKVEGGGKDSPLQDWQSHLLSFESFDITQVYIYAVSGGLLCVSLHRPSRAHPHCTTHSVIYNCLYCMLNAHI